MANPIKRGESGSQVSSWNPTSSAASSLVSTIVPYGLTLQQTILTTGKVAIPDGVTFVYAIVAGGGGGSSIIGGSGGAGGVAWGWTFAVPYCVVGGGGVQGFGGYTRYGNIIAGGGAGGINTTAPVLGGSANGSGSGYAGSVGSTNMWGIPNAGGNQGADSISGGGGAQITNNNGQNGGSGLVGGGGGGTNASGFVGGNGGNGINILTGALLLGGTGSLYSVSSGFGRGGGGAGIAGAGGNATSTAGGAGGLGGGGGGSMNSSPGSNGGAGIIYLYW